MTEQDFQELTNKEKKLYVEGYNLAVDDILKRLDGIADDLKFTIQDKYFPDGYAKDSHSAYEFYSHIANKIRGDSILSLDDMLAKIYKDARDNYKL